MLEILLLIALWKKMGSMMRDRGYSSTIWFQLPVILCWLVGEFLGGVIYSVIRLVGGSQSEGFDILLYLSALASAALFTGLYFLIASFARRPFQAPAPLMGQA